MFAIQCFESSESFRVHLSYASLGSSLSVTWLGLAHTCIAMLSGEDAVGIDVYVLDCDDSSLNSWWHNHCTVAYADGRVWPLHNA
jgi:hypothetical protein